MWVIRKNRLSLNDLQPQSRVAAGYAASGDHDVDTGRNGVSCKATRIVRAGSDLDVRCHTVRCEHSRRHIHACANESAAPATGNRVDDDERTPQRSPAIRVTSSLPPHISVRRVTEPAGAPVDPERDVFVAAFDVRLNYVHGRRSRSIRGAFWNVFLGRELIEHFEDLDAAIELARKVAMKTGRPTWMSADGTTFEAIG